MPSTQLRRTIKKWQEERLGVSLESSSSDSVPVIELTGRTSQPPVLKAMRLDGRALVAVHGSWAEPVRRIVAGMHPDLLFTVFGAYELSRATLEHGASVWGPSWYLFADRESWKGREDVRVRSLHPGELEGVDFDRFWHCFGADSTAAFGVFEQDRLVALSTVKDRGTPFMEIGMDVVQSAQSNGLGSAVVSAAGSWILEQGALPVATVAPFNVPSTRTLRGAGLEYGMTEMATVEGPFRVPPQALGSPLPSTPLFDYYPDWAMNRTIRPRSEM